MCRFTFCGWSADLLGIFYNLYFQKGVPGYRVVYFGSMYGYAVCVLGKMFSGTDFEKRFPWCRYNNDQCSG